RPRRAAAARYRRRRPAPARLRVAVRGERRPVPRRVAPCYAASGLKRRRARRKPPGDSTPTPAEDGTAMPVGYLSLVLHAHLPFVRHPEYDDFLEEDWLYEAITETYIPLLDVFDGLERDGVDWRLTMSVTPTLAAMLSDPLLQYRYIRHLENLISLAGNEIQPTRWHPNPNPLPLHSP